MNVTIQVPNGPYPTCACGGTLLPILEPRLVSAGSLMYHEPRMTNAIILVWQCATCQSRVGMSDVADTANRR